MKVDHAGEHGAICVYRAQRWVARWRAPDMIKELGEFLDHEKTHRARFEAVLAERRLRRCSAYHLCGLAGLLLGVTTGLFGRAVIAATTVAIEGVVLRHMHEQVEALRHTDRTAVRVLQAIIGDEQRHHDLSAKRLAAPSRWPKVVTTVVAASTEAVIWLGMVGPG